MKKEFIQVVIKKDKQGEILVVNLDDFKGEFYGVYTKQGYTVVSKEYLKTQCKTASYYDFQIVRNDLGLNYENYCLIFRQQLKQYKTIDSDDIVKILYENDLYRNVEKGKANINNRVVYGEIIHLDKVNDKQLEILKYFEKYGCILKKYQYRYAQEIKGIAMFIPN